MPAAPKAPKPAPGPDKAQLDRFKQTARELGCDETGEAFERAFAKAVPPRGRRPVEAKPGRKPD